VKKFLDLSTSVMLFNPVEANQSDAIVINFFCINALASFFNSSLLPSKVRKPTTNINANDFKQE
jgi:hypothetical protein